MKPKGKYAWSVTIGTKGQIVIPKEARELFGFDPGDSILLLGDEKQGIAIPPKSTYTTLFAHVFDQSLEKETEAEEE